MDDYLVRAENTPRDTVRFFFRGLTYEQYLRLVLEKYPIEELMLIDYTMSTSVCRDGLSIGGYFLMVELFSDTANCWIEV